MSFRGGHLHNVGLLSISIVRIRTSQFLPARDPKQRSVDTDQANGAQNHETFTPDQTVPLSGYPGRFERILDVGSSRLSYPEFPPQFFAPRRQSHFEDVNLCASHLISFTAANALITVALSLGAPESAGTIKADARRPFHTDTWSEGPCKQFF